MQSNPLLKWLLVPLAVLVLFVGLRLMGGAREAASSDVVSQLTPEEMKALGIEGDTPRDTVATLVGQVKQLRGELKNALEGNTAHWKKTTASALVLRVADSTGTACAGSSRKTPGRR